MNHPSLERTSLPLVLLLSVFAGCEASKEPAGVGVVVDRLQPGHSGEAAGLLPGDLLVSWERPPAPPGDPQGASGTLDNPFVFLDVQAEQAPRGDVTLSGWRDGRAFSAVLTGERWEVDVRPRFEGDVLPTYADAAAKIRDGDDDTAAEGAARLEKLGGEVARSGDALHAAWLYARAGFAWRDLGRLRAAQEAFELAARVAEPLGEAFVQARLKTSAGTCYLRDGQPGEAARLFGESLRLYEQHAGGSLAVASALNNLGTVERARGDRAAAESYHRRALELREELAPGSLAVTYSLGDLAKLAARSGDLAAAEKTFLEVLAIHEEKLPGTSLLAATYNSVGVTAAMQGDMATAEEYMEKSATLWREVDPHNPGVSTVVQNLGQIAARRGDLIAAEGYYREAMELEPGTSPDSLAAAQHLHNLGSLAKQRGEHEAAGSYYRDALAIRGRLAPDSLDVALTLSGLAQVAEAEDDLAAAEDFFRRALAIQQAVAPRSTEAGGGLHNLGQIAWLRGNLDEAEDYFLRGREILDRKMPRSRSVAINSRGLGQVALDRGDLEAAERRFLEALEIFRQLLSGTDQEAKTLHLLGRVYRARGRPELARGHFERAVEALESQAGKLGGSEETKSGFRAEYIHLYQDLIDLLLELDREGEAFHVLERSRSRALLALLAERDLIFDLDLPPDLERRRRMAEAAFDRAQTSLARLSPETDRGRVDAGLRELRELEQRQREIRDEIRRLSPRLAALRFPRPLDLAAARRALDPGTLLLSYSVGETRSLLFVLPAGGDLRVVALDLGEAELRRRVDRLRLLLEQPDSDTAVVAEVSARLYEALMADAEGEMEAAERVLIVPDGPLFKLPFGVLVRPADAAYLIARKPLHTASSVTVYEELRRDRGAPPETVLAAFGDPVFPSRVEGASREVEDTVLRSVRAGRSFEPLPASRTEVQAITELFGDGAVAFLGAEATEERAKVEARRARYVHFATHAVVDERFPLSSGLVLSIPERLEEGRDNGLLQAWEIFERVRLDADLVTLSACESALGKEVAGEGLIGLTRAFQYAGARTVAASLWNVSDRSTSALMTAFYRHLKSGAAKDEALRSAQLELLRGPVTLPRPGRRRGGFLSRLFGPGEETGAEPPIDASHPYHWAAFQIIGDWK